MHVNDHIFRPGIINVLLAGTAPGRQRRLLVWEDPDNVEIIGIDEIGAGRVFDDAAENQMQQGFITHIPAPRSCVDDFANHNRVVKRKQIVNSLKTGVQAVSFRGEMALLLSPKRSVTPMLARITKPSPKSV